MRSATPGVLLKAASAFVTRAEALKWPDADDGVSWCVGTSERSERTDVGKEIVSRRGETRVRGRETSAHVFSELAM